MPRGQKPWITSPQSGFSSSSSTAKQPPTRAIKLIATSSKPLTPHCCSNSSSSVSATVRATPQAKGRPNNSCRAMALPTSSARSQAMIASSAISHRGKRQRPGSRRALAWARSMPVAIPSRQQSDCNRVAIRLERATTQRSR